MQLAIPLAYIPIISYSRFKKSLLNFKYMQMYSDGTTVMTKNYNY